VLVAHGQGRGLRINNPHGAGFIGGSALHPINRMLIFLADANKKEGCVTTKQPLTKYPYFS